MKRVVIVILTALCLLPLHAQRQSLGVEIGFTEPILRENAILSDSKKLTEKTIMNGGRIGLVYDATLIKGFGVSLGVAYTLSGNHTDWLTDNAYGMAFPRYKRRNAMHSLQIPIDWQYKFEVAKNTYIIIYTGSTLKWNFRFRRNETTQQTVKSDEVKSGWKDLYEIDGDNDGKKDYVPINISWGVGAGFQYKNYYLRGGYDFGIYYPYKDAFYDSGTNAFKHYGRFDEWNIRMGIYFLNF